MEIKLARQLEVDIQIANEDDFKMLAMDEQIFSYSYTMPDRVGQKWLYFVSKGKVYGVNIPG